MTTGIIIKIPAWFIHGIINTNISHKEEAPDWSGLKWEREMT